jgi:hypothetical protein
MITVSHRSVIIKSLGIKCSAVDKKKKKKNNNNNNTLSVVVKIAETRCQALVATGRNGAVLFLGIRKSEFCATDICLTNKKKKKKNIKSCIENSPNV